MLLSKCGICGSKKSRFIKKQETSEILSSLDLRTHLTWWYLLLNAIINMNEIVNNFLLTWDKFMPDMHLKQPGFTYSAYGLFTKNKERIQKFKETGDTRCI